MLGRPLIFKNIPFLGKGILESFERPENTGIFDALFHMEHFLGKLNSVLGTVGGVLVKKPFPGRASGHGCAQNKLGQSNLL